MDIQQERPPPPAYAQHSPESLHLPSVPTHAPSASTTTASAQNTLPGIRSLHLPSNRASIELSPKSGAEQAQWGSLPPLTSATFPRVPEGGVRLGEGADAGVGSPMDTSSVVSGVEDRRREMSVVSVDDPDVRLAAEALSGLGNPDFVRSPTTRSLTLSADQEQEPLLSLITSNHPWLGGTINGSLAAYNSTKNYSPRFVKYGAELIERNIGSPVVNTVSSVGRRTGVEQNLRRYLGEVHRRPSDLDIERGDGSGEGRKRQRIMSPGEDAMDVDTSPRTRGGSQSSFAESLPAYDDQRSPNYEETAVMVVDPITGKESESRPQSSQDRRVNWSTQLIMTTSGLGVALSDASLRSLKICVTFLRSATKHIDSVMQALKLVLEEYDAAIRNRRQSDGETEAGAPGTVTAHMSDDKEDQVRAIADRMKTLSSDIWTTLQNVVQSVSRYTGGALPQNASQVVRTQLLSVPQRWQSASRSAAQEQRGEEARGAQRMLAFAKEGLDMIGQVTTVVDGTVQSAESWLARVGRRPASSSASEMGGQEKDGQGFKAIDYGEKH